MRTLLVILGAAIGAPARFAIDRYIRKFTDKPYGIFVVNVVGSFVFGLTINRAQNTYALFAIGFAGAFTTWSTFMLDFFLAYELKKYKEGAVNLSASIVFGLLAASLGMSLA
jgi:CrcB protein